jgi:Flp pilus assembly protein TadD
MLNRGYAAAALLLVSAITAVYSNHFGNGFHFDDWHTITQNPAIRELRNIPQFFTDGRTMSVLPANQAYRPIVTLSLALDHWMGGGLQPFAFHASMFGCFLVLLGCLFGLYRHILEGAWSVQSTKTGVSTAGAAMFATAWFGLHPVSAETVNYIVQRADLYVALGLTMGIVVYLYFPNGRKWGVYLLPVVIAALCKPTALIFPALVVLYRVVCDDARLATAVRSALPSIGVTAVLAIVHKVMTPPAFSSATSPWTNYVITQPAVTLHYFGSWFLPLSLTADSDRTLFASVWTPEALSGFAFVVALAGIAAWCRRSRATRPIAFGLFWFLITLAPVALMPLAEVDNDHRMFLPFVGLALAVTSAGILAGRKLAEVRPIFSSLKPAGLAACIVMLGAFAYGAHVRNGVWLNEETLWQDVTEKSPRNGRGWMNYGLSQMAKGDYGKALECFETALRYTPTYSYVHINLGIARGQMNEHARAEASFLRALELAPTDAQPHFYYGRYLESRGRRTEAVAHLQTAIDHNPLHADASELLSRISAVEPAFSADEQLRLSLAAFQAGRYRECIEAARRALAIRPDYAEAFNNIAAGHQALQEWDEAIAAAREAIRLRPDFQLARNNLAWSEQQRLVKVARR